MNVLIGSPVRQDSDILEAFLNGLSEVDAGNNSLSFYFIDDNMDEKATGLLEAFSRSHSNVILEKAEEILCKDTNYSSTDKQTHYWDQNAIDKITAYKNKIISYAKKFNFDYLFLIDSDIVINKKTILHLISRQVDIVSEVFWSQWLPNQSLVPQCFWIPSFPNVKRPFGESYSLEETWQAEKDFYAKLLVPGLYRVDGLGACTLITQNAIKKGVSFERIPNLSTHGEDKDFCIRAGTLGIPLYIDTAYPAYHIYRKEYLQRVDEYKRDGFKFDMCQTFTKEKTSDNEIVRITKKAFFYLEKGIKRVYHLLKEKKLKVQYHSKEKQSILLQMIVRNECGRYLEQVLESVSDFVDYYLIVDDASTDDTVNLCEKLLSDKPHTIIENKESLFHEEWKLRRNLWDAVERYNPGWVLSLDADEVMQKNAGTIIRSLIRNNDIDCYKFKYYDMWNENEYREDEFWHSHLGYQTYLMRYEAEHKYHWKKTNQHCGRFPKEVYNVPFANINLRIKHLGWVKEEDRQAKFQRYMKLDPEGKFGIMEQYNSILDEAPNLKRFDSLPDEL